MNGDERVSLRKLGWRRSPITNKFTREERNMTHVHTIPVDSSQTPDEAWRELCIFGRRVTNSGSETWAVIECDGQECRNIEDAS